MIIISTFNLSDEGAMFERLNRTVVFPAALVLAALCWPGAAAPQDATQGKFSGEYFLYGGTLDDRAPVTRKDAKVSIQMSGRLATAMFQNMGAAAAVNGCGSDTSEIRVRRELQCDRDRATGRVTCYFGIDLHSGKPVPGVIC
jgi:hypothetical protein